jgi:thioredoxin reductase (NADPH)
MPPKSAPKNNNKIMAYKTSQKSGALVASRPKNKKHRPQPSISIQPKDGVKVHDVVIIGAGPAALTAALYTGRDDIETIVYEKAAIGGIPAMTDWIENYPGFPEGITGLDFCERLQLQVEKFGSKIELGEVTGLQAMPGYIKLQTTDGECLARAVLIACGSDHKKLRIKGEDTYFAKGVHYCATCDGAFYRDKNIVVVGGGNSALQEALFLTRYAKHVDLLVRSSIRADDVLVHKVGQNKKISVHLHTTTDEVVGNDEGVTKVIGTHVLDNRRVELVTDGVFIFVGQMPNTGFLASSGIVFDEAGFIQTDHKLQTAVKGVFAAGDVRSGATMQIACAAGEGATAALNIREYLHHAPILDYKNIEA